MKERFAFIDFLRAMSIVGVMIIHTLSFFLYSPVNLFIWNSLQVVVALFIFCSGFVHASYGSRLVSLQATGAWFLKRARRILIPFYVYFALHYILFFFFPHNFTHFGLQKNLLFILGSIFLYGGINANWLPLLFLELTLLTPILFLLERKKKLGLYILIAILITFVGTFIPYPYSIYRILMWIPWSLVFLLGLFPLPIQKPSVQKVLSIFGFVAYSILLFVWIYTSRSINFTDNKYPPNFYYLFYCLGLLPISIIVAKKIVARIPQWTYEYVSRKSYSLFFIHFLILDFLASSHVINNVVILMLIVITASILLSLVLDQITVLVEKLRNQNAN